MPNDVAKIKGVQSQYVAACNADDIDAWQTILGNDFVFMPPDAPKVSGKKATAAWAKGTLFDPFKMRPRVKFDRVDVFGSQAFAPGSFTFDLTPKSGGNTIKSVGKAISGFKKQRDGSWKYSRVIWNYDKPPA